VDSSRRQTRDRINNTGANDLGRSLRLRGSHRSRRQLEWLTAARRAGTNAPAAPTRIW